MRALGRLLRLSLSASAIGDVVGGIVVASGGWPAGHEPFLLIGASLALYHGGMALNDWADRDEDARLRPDRPIPSGRIPAGMALLLGLGLLAGGVAAALSVGKVTGYPALCVAGCVLAYDLGPRGAVLGPLLLACARMGNLALGMQLGLAQQQESGLASSALAALVASYGLYVFLVSRLGRFEDAAEPPVPGFGRRQLRGASLLLLAIPVIGAWSAATSEALASQRWLGAACALVLTGWAAWGLEALARLDPREPRDLLKSMGALLRRLLIATTAMALLPGTTTALVAGALLLLGYPVSHALRRVFPPS